jgi:hypothetical protein
MRPLRFLSDARQWNKSSSRCILMPRREVHPVIKKLSDRRRELDNLFRGILFSLICIFILPVIFTVLILTAAILNLHQGSFASGLFADSYWRGLLSFTFRISLIPGIVYLTYLGLSRLRNRRGEKRLALVLVSLILFTVFIDMPPRQQSHAALSVADSRPQPLSAVVYRADSRRKEPVDKKPLLNSSQLQRSQVKILTKKISAKSLQAVSM